MFRKEKLSPEHREIRFSSDLPPAQRCDTIQQTRYIYQTKTNLSNSNFIGAERNLGKNQRCLQKKTNPGPVIVSRKLSPNKLLLARVQVTVPIQWG